MTGNSFRHSVASLIDVRDAGAIRRRLAGLGARRSFDCHRPDVVGNVAADPAGR
jgi:hypothetical protein